MGIEFRLAAAAPAAKGDKLNGMAAPFNSPTMIGKAPWGFREQIKPGAFTKTIKEDDQVLLDNHDHARPLARASAGTLEMRSGRQGLLWEATPADTTYARDVAENVRAGNYGGCSFAFECISDTWDYDTDDDIPLRTLNEVKMREISIVTFPAYGDTTVSARDQVDAALEAFSSWFERELKDTEEIGSKEHAKAAWDYINLPATAAKYPLNGISLASAKVNIRAACNKFGVKTSADQNAADLIVVEARDGITITFNSATWDEAARNWYLNEEKWIRPASPEGEPSRLTKEETDALKERARKGWRQRHQELKSEIER